MLIIKRTYWTSHVAEPALELHRRAVPSVEAHHGVSGPDTGRISGGRRIVKKYTNCFHTKMLFRSPLRTI